MILAIIGTGLATAAYALGVSIADSFGVSANYLSN